MVWPILFSVASTALQGLDAALEKQKNAKLENTITEANVYASNLIRGANNELKGARGSLARYNQSVNNQRTLENAGKDAEAAKVNYLRARDSAMSDDLEQQIAFSEQAGAQAAASALSGLTGGVVDLVNGTTALRKARIQQRVDDVAKSTAYDAGQRQGAILQAGWDSLDYSEISDDLDFSQDVGVYKSTNVNWLAAISSGQDPKNLANLAGGAAGFFKSGGFDAFADRAGPTGSGLDGRTRTITGGR